LVSSAESSLRLLEAVHALADSQLHEGEVTDALRAEWIEAVEQLRDAPPLDAWNRGLLGGLRSRDGALVDRTARAVVDRLEALTAPAAQDQLIAAVLDACFLNLAGRPRRSLEDSAEHEEIRRADAFEQAGAQLIRELTRLLSERPLELEHHRSRLLARARSIAHLAGRGTLAEAVVAFEHQIADGDRADQRVAAQLQEVRKFDLYTSPLTTQPTLLAYLARDRRLPIARASQELFQVYRMLLACQTKERARRALLAALDNLCHWLDQLPQTADEREGVLQDVLRARAAIPWEDLDLQICRHLEMHLELVPGSDHPEDLLALLERRYDSPEGSDILVRGLAVLRRLPLLRRRSQDICAFVLRQGRRQRSAEVWFAMVDWVGSYLTGLDDFVLTREALGRDEQRQNRARRLLLAHDRPFRDLLYRLATDDDLGLSRDAEVEAAVRERAWRILLRSLPANRQNLIQVGLLPQGHRFFHATLEEAAGGQQREWWAVVEGHWEELFEGDRPAEERRRRFESLADAFRRTRNFDAIQDGGEDAQGADDRLGSLIRVALDDSDSEVRRRVEESVVQAGYALELERERQRREILRLREDLTTTNRRIVELEERIGTLVQAATDVQLDRADHALEIQEGLQQRDGLITEGWLTAAGTQVDLEEVRVALVTALAQAEEQLTLLHALRRRMQQEYRTAQEIHQAIQGLVRQQEQQEQEIDRLQRQMNRAESQAAGARSERGRLQSRRAGLRPPSAPARTGDPERDRHNAAAHRQALARHESELRDLAARIHSLEGDEERYRREAASCRRGIDRARAALDRLEAQIREQQSRIAAVRQRIRSLESDFRQVQRRCEAIRREIAQLRDEVRSIESRAEAERQSSRHQLAANRSEIETLQGQMEEDHDRLLGVSRDLNQTGDERDRQVTRSQRLAQGIDSGRDNYERVAEEAVSSSALADAAGFSAQQAREQTLREDQELLVQYSYGVQRAVERQPRPITREERRRRRTARRPTS
jgi:predicted  nucleic acid-binding Zn-ribbon protein